MLSFESLPSRSFESATSCKCWFLPFVLDVVLLLARLSSRSYHVAMLVKMSWCLHIKFLPTYRISFVLKLTRRCHQRWRWWAHMFGTPHTVIIYLEASNFTSIFKTIENASFKSRAGRSQIIHNSQDSVTTFLNSSNLPTRRERASVTWLYYLLEEFAHHRRLRVDCRPTRLRMLRWIGSWNSQHSSTIVW